MPNLHRGEIEAEIGGARRRLVLTLGALAELEAAFGADDLVGARGTFRHGPAESARSGAHHRRGPARRGRGDQRRRGRAPDGRRRRGRLRAHRRRAARRDVRQRRSGPFGAPSARARGRASPPRRSRFPWKRAMGFGLGVLRLSPDAFWRMTPRELAAAMEACSAPRRRSTRRDCGAARTFPTPCLNRCEPVSAMRSHHNIRATPSSRPESTLTGTLVLDGEPAWLTHD